MDEPSVISDQKFAQVSYAACKGRARKLVSDRLKMYQPQLQVDFARVSIKDLKTRWGSCSSQKNLNFHYKIIFLPVELADYIIVHELCHLREMNHSVRFWQLVHSVLPDFKKRILLVRRIEKKWRAEMVAD